MGNWRCMSHLHAPEKLSPPRSIVANSITRAGEDWTESPDLKHNLHEFVRPVGHCITSHDRDSQYLARLRMDVAPKDELDADDRQDESIAKGALCKFVIIKFVRHGTVIWA